MAKRVAEYAYDHRLSEADAQVLAELACNAVLDPMFMAKVSIAVQENPEPDAVLYPLIRDELLAKWPAVLKRLKTATAGARRRGIRPSGS